MGVIGYAHGYLLITGHLVHLHSEEGWLAHHPPFNDSASQDDRLGRVPSRRYLLKAPNESDLLYRLARYPCLDRAIRTRSAAFLAPSLAMMWAR
jgi:hypothetical protein